MGARPLPARRWPESLSVAIYTAGRAWIEYLRVDHANHLLGLRLNDWTSLIVFTAAVVYLRLARPRQQTHPGDQLAPAGRATG